MKTDSLTVTGALVLAALSLGGRRNDDNDVATLRGHRREQLG